MVKGEGMEEREKGEERERMAKAETKGRNEAKIVKEGETRKKCCQLPKQRFFINDLLSYDVFYKLPPRKRPKTIKECN